MNYDGVAFCGHESREAPLDVGASLPRWPSPRITWRVVQPLPQIAQDAYRRCIAEAFARWSRVCGLVATEAPSGPANIEIGLQTERPGNILADCQLPYQGIHPQASLKMRVDTAETWCISDNPPQNRIDLTRVICHELGHGLGLSHLGSGALMAPTYSTLIATPQREDIAAAVARYGLPSEDQHPVPQPTPEGERELLRILNRGGRVVIRLADGREVQA